MQSKEEIENDNTYKISVSLIDSTELNNIDNYYEEIVDRFLKSFVKELVIAQHLMQKQQDKIQQLETDKQKLIEKLEEDIKELDFIMQHDEEDGFGLDENHFAKYTYAQKILKILKGENDGKRIN